MALCSGVTANRQCRNWRVIVEEWCARKRLSRCVWESGRKYNLLRNENVMVERGKRHIMQLNFYNLAQGCSTMQHWRTTRDITRLVHGPQLHVSSSAGWTTRCLATEDWQYP